MVHNKSSFNNLFRRKKLFVPKKKVQRYQKTTGVIAFFIAALLFCFSHTLHLQEEETIIRILTVLNFDIYAPLKSAGLSVPNPHAMTPLDVLRFRKVD